MKPIIVEFEGEQIKLCDLERKLGFKQNTLIARYRNGDRGEHLVRPISQPKYYTCEGCKKAFQSPPSAKSRFCSRFCMHHYGRVTQRHGKSNTRLHVIWCGMRSRCKGANSPLIVKYYRSRGITVCDEWASYEVFEAWALANGYEDGLEIDRRKNNLGYSPENCRWATRTQQMANTRKRCVKNGTSRFKGVSPMNRKKGKRYKATITEAKTSWMF